MLESADDLLSAVAWATWLSPGPGTPPWQTAYPRPPPVAAPLPQHCQVRRRACKHNQTLPGTKRYIGYTLHEVSKVLDSICIDAVWQGAPGWSDGLSMQAVPGLCHAAYVLPCFAYLSPPGAANVVCSKDQSWNSPTSYVAHCCNLIACWAPQGQGRGIWQAGGWGRLPEHAEEDSGTLNTHTSAATWDFCSCRLLWTF